MRRRTRVGRQLYPDGVFLQSDSIRRGPGEGTGCSDESAGARRVARGGPHVDGRRPGTGQWDWAGAEREYRRAIQLAPNYASAYHWYTNNLSIRDRHDEAIALGTRAAELDPLSPIIHVALGHAYYLAGRYDEAIGELQRALEIEPSFANAHQFLGQAYARKGLHEEAVTEFRQADAGDRWLWKSALAHLHVRMGRLEEAKGSSATSEPVDPWFRW